jgi:signal transduction histidine kinase
LRSYKEPIKPISVTINGQKKDILLGKKITKNGIVFTLTSEEKYIKRPKLFKKIIEMSAVSLEPITKFQKELIEKQNAKTEEFIHNVTALNSYSIQDLYALIPQNTLSENINKQKDFIKNIIIEQPNNTVKTLLQLIKYNLAMKVEFSVFERTQKPPGSIKKFSHSIRSILLSILQIFIDDFEKREIIVSLDAGEDSEKRIEVDYDSLFVSFFYLLENSLKYCCPKTKFKIFFNEEKDCFSISFIMISLKIEDSEIRQLTDYGYRSEIAKKVSAEGKGIGMYRIIKTLRLNNAELEINPRINDYTRKIGNIDYEANQFKIKFIGQQNWFRTN